jgi:oligosaccharide repeat unit polymerase
MFVLLSWVIAIILGLGVWYAYAGSRDVFHPLIFIAPMMAFMYTWMPLTLDSTGGLAGFFQRDQVDYVQKINLCGVACFVLGCLSLGSRIPAIRVPSPEVSNTVLVLCGSVLGTIGFVAWVVAAIHGSSGELMGYKGAWDDSGYVRDASMLVFPAVLLILPAAVQQGVKPLYSCLVGLFLLPSIIEATFTARRGPTFMIAVTIALGWFMNRQKRPPILLTVVAGGLLGLLMLFLVSNRQNIYVGSDREMNTDITSIVEKPDAGNEYIYGTGTILSSEQRDSFYWGRRYLAEIVVRPVPSSIWPTKYQDFGLPELMHNAGTGEGFAETLGWEGAQGSAPGLIADLWAEFHWLNMPVLFILGRLYCAMWRKAQVEGGVWLAQYIIMAALSVYLVMQTMEAVIYRSLILSIPLRLSWRIARRAESAPMIQPAMPGVYQ